MEPLRKRSRGVVSDFNIEQTFFEPFFTAAMIIHNILNQSWKLSAFWGRGVENLLNLLNRVSVSWFRDIIETIFTLSYFMTGKYAELKYVHLSQCSLLRSATGFILIKINTFLSSINCFSNMHYDKERTRKHFFFSFYLQSIILPIAIRSFYNFLCQKLRRHFPKVKVPDIEENKWARIN